MTTDYLRFTDGINHRCSTYEFQQGGGLRRKDDMNRTDSHVFGIRSVAMRCRHRISSCWRSGVIGNCIFCLSVSNYRLGFTLLITSGGKATNDVGSFKHNQFLVMWIYMYAD